MRTVLAMAAAFSLSACSGDSADFQLKLDDSPEAILAEFDKMDPNAIMDAAGLEAIETSRPNGNSVLFTLPAPKGKDAGTFLFSVESIDASSSMLEVAVDLPFVTRKGAGGTQYLNESAIEDALKDSLKSYQRQLKAGRSGSASIREAGDMVGYAGVGLQNIKEFEKLAESAAMSRFFSSEEGALAEDWGNSESDGWGDDSPSLTDEPDYADYENDYGAETEAEFEDASLTLHADTGGWGEDAYSGSD